MGTRRFGRVNWLGMTTLAERETRRFMAVWSQTVMAPLITAVLFLAVFGLALGTRRGEVMGLPFLSFIAPGILMMSVIQNAFANTSSSILVAKVQGNIVDTLMPPLSAGEMLAGYLAGALARGLLVSLPVLALMMLYLGTGLAHPLWLALVLVVGSALMGCLGIIGAIYAEKFDQMSVISNFVITPLTFLSGTFYSIEVLPPAMQALCHVNPIFYLIDGARYAILGVSDSSPWLGMGVCLAVAGALAALSWHWLRSGHRLKP
ncbi:ABC transporter permease [Mangrovicoccus sp. HB182678]|uniref:Transport permease protein n=2 Tax=Mangrovicoccus algicola TaxID=2771008 RepID=A0A8J6YQU8_9RHOB|nr:ABC transporter permease [Mangrovicoccus algicola]